MKFMEFLINYKFYLLHIKRCIFYLIIFEQAFEYVKFLNTSKGEKKMFRLRRNKSL